jgi:hypothetical protein
MNFKNRIDELNTNLVLKETILFMLIDDLKNTSIKADKDSNKKFRFLINEIQHNKSEYDSIYIQLKTFTAYQAKHLGVKT